MKRTVCLALAMSMVMGTTAFAAERNPIVLVNRQEFFLQDTAMQKNGKWLFSAEDLAEMTGSQMTNRGESLLADGTDGCFAGGWYAGCNSEGERQTVFGG